MLLNDCEGLCIQRLSIKFAIAAILLIAIVLSFALHNRAHSEDESIAPESPITYPIDAEHGIIYKPNIPTSTPIKEISYTGQVYSQDEVQNLIISYSKEFQIDPTIPLRIAKCESNYHWNSKNSSSTASGVYQFIASTWAGTPEGKSGLSPFDADANVRAAIRKISQGGINAWDASKSCWKN